MTRSSPSFEGAPPPAEDEEGDAGASNHETIESLARRVLFADSLDEKLKPGPRDPIPAPEEARRGESFAGVQPGRPADLRFAPSGSARPKLPARPALVDEENRGVLLHFFANHELLAAELMALALLQFPDAPEAFRRGLAGTLREEQRHTRWYVERMRQCGVTFGQYPVNRFFWDAVSSMETPLDYVSRLSLTFEQANLDYARHYADVLDEAGDGASAAILERIYRDEIGHVGYGLRWFREWKTPGASDWDELERRLVFPLAPSRAKGNRADFNAAGRREAGFDEEYIRRLSLFERSKGRTPDVYYFNPDAENRVAALPQVYHPSDEVRSVIEDLEILGAVLARRDDVLLMRRPPSESHREALRDAGLVLPEIEPLDDRGDIAADSLIRRRKIGRFRPWARSPELPERFEGLTAGAPGGDRSVEWRTADRALFSKADQARALGDWLGSSRPVRSRRELADAAAALRESGWRRGLLKRAIATAGGGTRRVDLAEIAERLTDALPRHAGKALGVGEEFVLEPLHDRVFDFSMQYHVQGGQLRLLGPVEQIISAGGGYRGSISPPKFCQGLEPAIARHLMNEAFPSYEEDAPFARDLRHWALAHDYDGPLGVDGYLYRGMDGELHHRVACEVNARYTMGRVAWELRRRFAPRLAVKLEIRNAKEAREDPPSPQPRDGQVAGGGLVLNDLHRHSRYAAEIRFAKQRAGL